jgi:hypothetical protein
MGALCAERRCATCSDRDRGRCRLPRVCRHLRESLRRHSTARISSESSIATSKPATNIMVDEATGPAPPDVKGGGLRIAMHPRTWLRARETLSIDRHRYTGRRHGEITCPAATLCAMGRKWTGGGGAFGQLLARYRRGYEMLNGSACRSRRAVPSAVIVRPRQRRRRIPPSLLRPGLPASDERVSARRASKSSPDLRP